VPVPSNPAARKITGTGQPVPVAAADGEGPDDDAGDAQSEADQPQLGVAAAARRLGIAPATLRTWDRRYGLGPSEHAPGRHRRYSAEDLARLDLMRRALLRGASAADAARHARTAPLRPAEPAPEDPPPAAPDSGAVPDGPDASAPLTGPHEIELEVPSRAGGGTLRLGTAGPAARGLGRAAMALDAAAVRQLLTDAIESTGTVAAWDEVTRPVLAAVAQRWAYSGAGVEIEHLLSECVSAVFGARAVTAPSADAPPVLLASMPGDHHALPTVALAAALAERGVACRPLGADLPLPALVAAVRRTAPAVVFLWSQMAATADADVLRALPRTRPRFRTYVGGPGWYGTELPPRVLLLESLVEACTEIAGAVSV
jgi:MerR family transcriptional regulator, light-induced transcriptional regulator